MEKKICLLILISLAICQAEDNKNVLDTKICKTCRCNKDDKLIDCSKLNLTQLFTAEDWTAINNTDMVINKLDLSNNKIEKVTQFAEIGVIHLDLSLNQISNIEESAFKFLKNLEILDLSKNLLTSDSLKPEKFQGNYDPTELQPIKKLRILKLGNNDLHTLDANLFEHFPNLEELHLNKNPFKIINQESVRAIADLTYLKYLDLSEMELYEIPGDVFHTPRNLEVVDLTGNLLTQIPKYIALAENLKRLTLDNNPIMDIELEHVFPSMPNLEYLSISYTTSLRAIGKGAFSNLSNLTELVITNNLGLVYIDKEALSRRIDENNTREEWPAIKTLHLTKNNLTTLDSHFIGHWENLEIVDFTYNPWSCDCDNQWLVDTLLPMLEEKNTTKEYKTTIIDGVFCGYPEQMKNVHLSELAGKHSKLRCLDIFGSHPERDGIILVSILAGLIIGILLTIVLVWLQRNGYLAFCGNKGPADYSRAFYKRAGDKEDFYI